MASTVSVFARHPDFADNKICTSQEIYDLVTKHGLRLEVAALAKPSPMTSSMLRSCGTLDLDNEPEDQPRSQKILKFEFEVFSQDGTSVQASVSFEENVQKGFYVIGKVMDSFLNESTSGATTSDEDNDNDNNNDNVNQSDDFDEVNSELSSTEPDDFSESSCDSVASL